MQFPKQVRIGSFGGAPIWLHLEACVALPCVGLGALLHGPITGLILIAVTFFSILAHEMGHAFAARRFALRVEGIHHLGVAGLCVFEDPGPRPKTRCLIAAAGPLVNLAIAGLCLPFAVISGNQGLHVPVATSIVVMNVIMCGGNLLPIYPLDGSKIMVELLAMCGPRLRAVLLTSLCGLLLSVPLILLCLALVFVGYPVVVVVLLRTNWRIFRTALRDWRDQRSHGPAPRDAEKIAAALMTDLLNEHKRRNAHRRSTS